MSYTLETDFKSSGLSSSVTSLSSVCTATGDLVLATCMDGHAKLLRGSSLTEVSTSNVNSSSSSSSGSRLFCGTLARRAAEEGGDQQIDMYYGAEDGRLVQQEVGSLCDPVVIGRHDGPICFVKQSLSSWGLVTGSWDKTVRVWDLRSPTAARLVQFSGAIEAMDIKGDNCVCVTDDGYSSVYDFRSGSVREKWESMNKYRTQSCAIAHNDDFFVTGSLDGRCTVTTNKLGRPSNLESGYVFPTTKNEFYAVNALQFNAVNSMFSVGSDGMVYFWQIEKKFRNYTYKDHKMRGVGTAACYSSDGTRMYYAMTPNLDSMVAPSTLAPPMPPVAHGSHTTVYGHTLQQRDIWKDYSMSMLENRNI